MKKLVKILVPFLALSATVLSGCKKEDTRVLLSFGDVHATESASITVTRLVEITESKENFLLVVTTSTCACWSYGFKPVLNKYISDTKALCYQIDYEKIQDHASNFGLDYITSSTTTFAIFENGVLKTTINTTKNGNIMEDDKKFAQYMDENVILPSCYFINKEDIENIKTSGKNAVIYFERTSCGDCQALNPTLLRSYIKAHPNMNKLYVFDCQPYYRKKTDEDYQSYVDVKHELGLSNVNNPIYGFNDGVFPFFSYIENGAYASGAVVYNERISKVDEKYYVTGSYYTNERVPSLQYTDIVLEGKEVPVEELNISETRAIWKEEFVNKAYEPIVNSFLDYALEKVTYNF